MGVPGDDTKKASWERMAELARMNHKATQAEDYYPTDEGLRIARLNAAAVEHYREAVEAGDGDALLASIALIASSGGAGFPRWLAGATLHAIQRYRDHEAATLDEAFHVSRPPRYRRAKARELATTAHDAIADIVALHLLGLPIDGNLFEAVGTLYGAGKTKVSEWYYDNKAKAREIEKVYNLVGVQFGPELMELARTLGHFR